MLNAEKSLRSALDLATIHPPDGGALNHTLLMLACGHDSGGGKYVYNGNGRPKAVWPHVTQEVSFKKIRAEMKKVNDQLGGTFIPNPRSELFGGSKVQVTHPLGGCPMGNTPGEGVVDHLGQVFDADGGIHRGLFVADASIIPRSLGATPLMTVSALSERIADFILAQMPELLS
jgi:cholesterol oxidase